MLVDVRNDGDDCLFRVRAVLDEAWDEEPTALLTDERIGLGTSKSVALNVPIDTQVLLQVTTVDGVGKRRDFEHEAGPARAAKFGLVYARDATKGDFSTRAGWRRGQRPGPNVKMVIELHNNYAESIFHVRAVLDQDRIEDTQPLLANARIERGGTRAVVLLTPSGTEVLLQIEVVSLGNRYSFEHEAGPAQAHKYVLNYDYDMALARFRVRGGWEAASHRGR